MTKHDSPYAPPGSAAVPSFRDTVAPSVRWCVGVASALFLIWLSIPICYALAGGGMVVISQNLAMLVPIALAAVTGSLAALRVRSSRSWFRVLCLWMPIAVFPVAVALYNM